MASIPANFNIYNLTINTSGIFIFLALISMFFIVWKEGLEDGFDAEKLFDMFLVSSFFAIISSRSFYALNHVLSSREFFSHIYSFWVPGHDLLGGLFGFLIPVYIFSRVWSWSIYRLLDIFGLGLTISLAIISASYVAFELRYLLLFAFAAWILIYVALSKLRNNRLSSGYSFSVILIILSVYKYMFFKEHNDLNFISALVTLSLLVFIFRWRISNYGKTLIKRVIGRVKTEIARKKERTGQS